MHIGCREQGAATRITLLILLLFLPRLGISGQANTATVRGAVQERTGAPLAGATVTVKNLTAERSRTVSSNAEGQFEILQLVPGLYEVEVSRGGFVAPAARGLSLRAGQSVTLNFLLNPAVRPPEPTTPRSEGARAASSTSPAGEISESQLVGLPLNGRSYSQLATLQSAVNDPFGGSAYRGGGGGGLTVAGGRPASNNFLLDGTNIMDTNNQVPRSAAGVQLGSDAVLQVQFFSSNYGAEYGRGSGGTLNSITRSGTPQWHGTFFEFFRNSKLDARNFFDRDPDHPQVRSNPPPFKRNQFGFTLTGPVRKERTFLMGSYEAMRDRLTITDISYFPDSPARQGIITDALGREIVRVGVNARVKPYLALMPVPNAGSIGEGFGKNAASQFLPTNENSLTVRWDHPIAERDSFFARYTFDDATSYEAQPVYLFTTVNESRQQYLTLVETHRFGPGVLNSFRFGFTRPVEARETLFAIAIPPALFFVAGAPQFGQISLPATGGFGPTPNTPASNIMSTFQFANDVLVQRGAHGLRLGAGIHRYRWDVFSNSYKGASWSFNSLESFLQGGPEGTSLRVALPGSDNRQAFRQTLLGFYAQDTYRVSPRLQFNLGLRYEFTTLLHDKDGKSAFLADPVRDTAMQIGSLLSENPSLRSLSPRLGISWSAGGSQDTVLSAGFGIYYDQLVEYVVDGLKDTAPFYLVAVNPNFDSSTTFPDAVAAVAATQTLPQARALDYHGTSLPRVLRYHFSLQQQFPGDWRFQAAYAGARGNHLFRTYEANQFPVPMMRADGSLFFPPNAGPVNPAFGSIQILSSDAQSFYNSLQLSASKNLGRGTSLQASYTFAKSIDDASSHTGSSQYGLRRTLERGLSDFDIRHRVVLNYFYTTPFGRGQRWWQSGIGAHLLGHWRIGGILSLRTGTPASATVNVRTRGYLFAPTRPNLLPGQSHNPVRGATAGCPGVEAQKVGTPDLYFDPCVFTIPEPGTLGNVGRNTIIAPNVFNTDVSLQRDFFLDAKRRLQFRAEVFNLSNHTNFNRVAPGIVFTGNSGRVHSTAGQFFQTLGNARQIQFALRFSF